MKKILLSAVIIIPVLALVIGGTIAFYNDTETSTGNIFTAGSIDLKVDHAYASYNGQECVGSCTEEGSNLILNGDFENPDVPSGGWAIFTNADVGQTSWTIESGAGLEIQDHAAGNPHSERQLAELDSDNSSVISQTVTTVPGQEYRLKFFYSPRPNRLAGDNTIGVAIKVMSGTVTLISDTVGAASVGGPNTVWQEITYNFIATDTSTKIIFSDGGTNNSYGGYLDDITLKTLNCSYTEYTNGGVCTIWGEKDLGDVDTFWNFSDIKPGDWGRDIISLHVYDNDAWACMLVKDGVSAENGILGPEGNDEEPDGELQNYITFFAWKDNNKNNEYDAGDTALGISTLGDLGSLASYDSDNGEFLTEATNENVGLAWCAGQISVDEYTIGCDGDTMLNDAQSDSFISDLELYAEQVRNNGEFSCADVTSIPPYALPE